MNIKTVELPLKSIQASGGFALDIGGSVAKLIYRSKEDYKNGEPKDKSAIVNGRGKLRMIHMAREKIDEVIDYIAEHCDLSETKGDDKLVIYSTGLGGNQFQEKIEGRLNVQMKNLTEFDCFVNALCLLLKEMPAEDIFKPVDEVGIEQGKLMLKVFRTFKEGAEATGKGSIALVDNPDLNPGDSHFPFMMIMCGSGFGFIKVEKDGSFQLVDGTNVAGRFFLGCTSFLTGIKDFDEISNLLKESDGKTVDTFGTDIVRSEGDDLYSKFKVDMRIFPFGKGLTDASDKATKGDLIHSLLETICENTAHLAYQSCKSYGVKRAYFVGNFVNTPKAQQFLTKTLYTKQHQGGDPVIFEFIKNGGHMGAIGCFLEHYRLAEEDSEKAKSKEA